MASLTVRWWGPDFSVTLNMSLLILGAAAGAVGSFIRQSMAFARSTGTEERQSYVWWYLLRPLWSALLGAVAVVAVNTGLISIGDELTSSAGVAVLVLTGCLAGFFTDQVLRQLRRILGADHHRTNAPIVVAVGAADAAPHTTGTRDLASSKPREVGSSPWGHLEAPATRRLASAEEDLEGLEQRVAQARRNLEALNTDKRRPSSCWRRSPTVRSRFRAKPWSGWPSSNLPTPTVRRSRSSPRPRRGPSGSGPSPGPCPARPRRGASRCRCVSSRPRHSTATAPNADVTTIGLGAGISLMINSDNEASLVINPPPRDDEASPGPPKYLVIKGGAFLRDDKASLGLVDDVEEVEVGVRRPTRENSGDNPTG